MDSTVSARVYWPDDPTRIDVGDISTTTGLVIKSDFDGDGVFETTWSTTDYQLEPSGGVRNGIPGWPYTRIRMTNRTGWPYTWRFNLAGAIEVTAKWGWSAVPALVKQACLIRAAELWQTQNAPHGVLGFGDYGVVVRIRENPVVVDLLQPFITTTGIRSVLVERDRYDQHAGPYLPLL